jgi:hypothetical protein
MNGNEQQWVSEKNLDAATTLAQELEQVEGEVHNALVELRMPFGQLVQSQLRNSFPLLRGAFVLAAGLAEQDTDHVRSQRINLAAAIEMLRLALSVHTRLLLSPAAQTEIDRSLLGSTVLAGDFCFSRSAGLAAKTGSPIVVDVFAQALQRVSEGTLRRLFSPKAPAYNTDRELCLSGIAAAGILAKTPDPVRSIEQQLGLMLMDAAQEHSLAGIDLGLSEAVKLSPARLTRWQHLLEWLRSH